MAYDTKRLFNKAKKIITKNPMLVYIEELADELGIDRATFYRHFPDGCDKNNTIKELLQKNKTKTKRALRTKWMKGNNATTEIALYKLIGTDEERKILNNNKLELGNADNEPLKIVFNDDYGDDE